MDIIAGKMFFSPSRSTSADITEGLPTPRVCREKIFAFLFFAKEKLKVKKSICDANQSRNDKMAEANNALRRSYKTTTRNYP